MNNNDQLNNFPIPGQVQQVETQQQQAPAQEGTSLDALIANAQPVAASLEYEKLPEGTYQCILHDAKYGLSKTGKSMFTLTYKIKGGAYDDQHIIENFILSGISDNFLAMNANNLTNRLVNTFGIAKVWNTMDQMEQTVTSFLPQMANMMFNVSIYYAVNAKTNVISEYSTIDKVERV